MYDAPIETVYAIQRTVPSDRDLDSLMTSIQEIGVQRPILVQETSHGLHIIDGFKRYIVANRLGLSHIPVVIHVPLGEQEDGNAFWNMEDEP